MTSLANNFNGISSGTTITTANSGGVSGNAFSIALVPSGGSLSAQSSAAFEGATGAQLVYPSTSAGGYVGWSVTATGGTRISASGYVRFASLPTVTETFINLSGVGHILKLTPTGQVALFNSTSASTAYATSTATLSTGTWYYIQTAATWGTTASNGRNEVNVILASNGGTVYSLDTGTTTNTGPVSGTPLFQFGRGINVATANTVAYDLIAVDNTLSSGFPGTAPTVTGGQVKVYVGGSFVAKPVKVWTGTAWVTKPVKRWTGTAWVTTTY